LGLARCTAGPDQPVRWLAGDPAAEADDRRAEGTSDRRRVSLELSGDGRLTDLLGAHLVDQP
jgi:hypothetical protein